MALRVIGSRYANCTREGRGRRWRDGARNDAGGKKNRVRRRSDRQLVSEEREFPRMGAIWLPGGRTVPGRVSIDVHPRKRVGGGTRERMVKG